MVSSQKDHDPPSRSDATIVHSHCPLLPFRSIISCHLDRRPAPLSDTNTIKDLPLLSRSASTIQNPPYWIHHQDLWYTIHHHNPRCGHSCGPGSADDKAKGLRGRSQVGNMYWWNMNFFHVMRREKLRVSCVLRPSSPGVGNLRLRSRMRLFSPSAAAPCTVLCMSRIFFANGELNESVFMWWTLSEHHVHANFLKSSSYQAVMKYQERANDVWSHCVCLSERVRKHTHTGPGAPPPAPPTPSDIHTQRSELAHVKQPVSDLAAASYQWKQWKQRVSLVTAAQRSAPQLLEQSSSCSCFLTSFSFCVHLLSLFVLILCQLKYASHPVMSTARRLSLQVANLEFPPPDLGKLTMDESPKR